MGAVKDIRPLKMQMRKNAKNRRRALDKNKKLVMDKKIRNKLLNMWCVRESDAVLIYVSSEIEVETKALIKELLKLNRPVAVPKCEAKAGEMNFYYIHSLKDLEKGAYGILEPKSEITNKVDVLNSENMICIVPGLAFDKKGFRLGYGKGYYDRYLKKFKGKTIGICYGEDLEEEIFHSRYDKTVDLLVTEKDFFTV